MARRTTKEAAPEAAAGGAEAKSGDNTAAAESAAPAPDARLRRQSQPRKSGAGRGKRKETSQARRLIEALLTSRDKRGATEQDLEQVVRWAERIRSEAAAIEADAADLRKRGPRGGRSATGAAATRQRQQRQLKERRLQNELDQALLTGVLEGKIALDVQPEGRGLLFLDGSSGRTSAPVPEMPAR